MPKQSQLKKGLRRYQLVSRTGDREVYQATLDDKPYDATTPRACS